MCLLFQPMSKKMKNEYYFQNQFGVYNVVNNFVNEGINDGVKKELVKVTKLIINKPSNPSPLNNAINQNTSLTLSWYSSDPDEDPLTYDIYLGTNNPPTNKVSTSQTAKSYNATNLSNSTTYFWKIIAKDDHSHSDRFGNSRPPEPRLNHQHYLHRRIMPQIFLHPQH